jgi:hypothetical protein
LSPHRASNVTVECCRKNPTAFSGALAFVSGDQGDRNDCEQES